MKIFKIKKKIKKILFYAIKCKITKIYGNNIKNI